MEYLFGVMDIDNYIYAPCRVDRPLPSFFRPASGLLAPLKIHDVINQN